MESARCAATDEMEQSLANATRELLNLRTAGGYWCGELSSSALSTATALFALRLFNRQHEDDRRAALIEGGIAWLIAHQNSDGGWGDTTISHSNISTTALCWAALAGENDRAAAAIGAAESWLTRAAGSLA